MTRLQGRAPENSAGMPAPGPGGDAPRPARLSTDQALAVLVHELRSPLGVIRNALEILRLSGTSGPAFERSVAVMERQSGHMARLVADLLDLTRVVTGKLQLRPEWIDLTTAVALAVEAARPLADASGHRLTTSVPPGPLRLRADRARLHQVLVNLLTTAAKYTDPGGHVRLAVEAAGGVLVVRVRGDGTGVAPEVLPRVFELSQQAPGPGGRGRDGLGIGLALGRWLVELHGGSVSAHGGPGVGSEFVVRWPAPAGREVRKAPLALAAPSQQSRGKTTEAKGC